MPPRTLAEARTNAPAVVALELGAALTVLVSLLPFVNFAYDNPSLHLALETGEGLIAGLLAYLAAQRFRATGRLQHLALVWAFTVLATVNLLLSAVPIVTLGGRPVGAVVWAAVGLRLTGVAGLAVAAFAGTRPAPRGPALVRPLLAVTLAAFAAVALAVGAAEAWLGVPVDPGVPPESSGRPRLVGHPVVLAVQVVAFGLYAGAATGFTRQARGEPDVLLPWLGAGAVLGAFARVNYFLFPSLYSNWVYTGDVLRLGSYLCFLVGAAREIDAYWRGQARLAALEERRRLARDLHDGLTQELAFIRSQTSAMASGMEVPGMVEHVAAAAERALVESRRAIEALAGGDEDGPPLTEALRHAAEDVAGRMGVEVVVAAADVPAVGPAVRDALLRVVREATTNAVKHGGAKVVTVRLASEDGELHLTVEDDGVGFDPRLPTTGFGLRSMCERVEGLGGSVRVLSTPASGTTLHATVPPFRR